MTIGYDQDMGGGGWMCVVKSCHQIVAIEHPFGCSTIDDLTKDARGISPPPAQQPDHQKMNRRMGVYKVAQFTWFHHPG